MKKLVPGDIILIRDGHSFVSRGIMFFMRIYKRKKGINLKANYHHVGTIVQSWGVLKVAEAVGKGFKVHRLEEAYSEKEWNERIDVITPDIEYTSEEQQLVSKTAEEYSLKINRYDFMNFLFQIWLIYTGKWIGPRGKKAENRFYCSEAAATIANFVRPCTFKNPAATNPVDIAINTNYHFR